MGHQPIDEAERDFVLRLAAGGNAITVSIDHVSEVLADLGVAISSVPSGSRGNSLPSCAAVVPKLSEECFQQIRGIEPPVGGEQKLQVLARAAGEILRTRQQCVFLAIDEGTRFGLMPDALVDSDGIERLSEMSNESPSLRPRTPG